jgi:hypothetical protein
VIVVAASLLEQAPQDIETIAGGEAPYPRILSLLKDVKRDIFLNLRTPFTKSVADHLSSFLYALLDHIIVDLEEAPNSMKRPITAPDELERLKQEGVDILDEIEPYAMLAQHHFSVEIDRHERPTEEVSKEIYELKGKAKILKNRIVKYLEDFYNFLAAARI